MLRQHKLMQRLVTIFFTKSKWLVAVALLVFWLLSCNTGGPTSGEPQMLSYEGTISNYTGPAETYEIKLQLLSEPFDQVTIGAVSFKTDGSFTLKFEKVDAKYLSHEISGILYENECSGLVISPDDWKGLSLYDQELKLFKDTEEKGGLDAVPIQENAAVGFFYMDKEVSMKGSCPFFEGVTWSINASFKKGWTAALYAANADETTLSVTTPEKIELGWSYEPIVVYENDWLDLTFGNNGLVVTNFGYANSIAIDSVGKMVVVGGVGDIGSSDFAIARYHPDGTLDTSFGDDGMTTTDFKGEDFGASVVIDKTGKIVVAGNSNKYLASVRDDFAVARYNPNGSLDTSFGDGGIITTDFDMSNDTGIAVTIGSDNKIVVAGSGPGVSGTGDFLVARYNPDGSLDTSFSDDGMVTTDFNMSYDVGLSVAINSLGKIVVAGFSTVESVDTYDYYDFAIVQYNLDGSLDTSFSNDGKVTTDLGSNSGVSSVTIDNTERIIVAGGNSSNFAIARYHPDGSLDSSFGSGGIVMTDFDNGTDYGHSVAIDNVGKIAVVGETINITEPYNSDFAVARYNSDGSLDTNFSDDGKVRTDFANFVDISDDIGKAVAIDSSGRIVAVGVTSKFGFAIARYNP